MKVKKNEKFREMFLGAYKTANIEVCRHLMEIQGTSKDGIFESMIWACYDALVSNVATHLVVKGKIVNKQGPMSPQDRVTNEEKAVAEILEMIRKRLSEIQPKYEFSVWTVKKRKKA